MSKNSHIVLWRNPEWAVAEDQVQREKRILKVAKNHFEKYGYKRTVIDDIVHEVGIAKGTFYLHFKSKEELFLRVIQWTQDRLRGRMSECLERNQTPAELIRGILILTLENFEKEPLLAELLHEGSENFLMRKLLSEPQIEAELDSTLAFFRNVLEEGIRIGEFREDLDLEVTSFVLGSVKFLYSSGEMITAGRIPARKFFEVYIDTLMHGLLKSTDGRVDPNHRRTWISPLRREG